MSNVVMDQPKTNGHAAIAGPGPVESAQPQAQSSFDIVQILWRWKWLPILGSIVGACLGFLYFSRQPATYEAAALVQVVNSMPMRSTRTDVYSQDSPFEYGRVDESMVIRSQRVLTLAVEKGGLTEQADFLGMQRDEVVAALMDVESTLTIEPADKDDNTTLIMISYISEDAEVAANVVNAIVAGYSVYLNDEYKSVGDEITDLVTKAEEKLSNTFQELSKQDEEFRKKVDNVVWSGDEASDPYAENYAKFHTEVANVRMEREKLENNHRHAKAAIEAGISHDSVLLMLAESGNSFRDPGFLYEKSRFEMDGPEFDLHSKIDTESARIEREILFPLRVRANVLLDSVGSGHPSAAMVQKEIDLVKQQVDELREGERVLDNELERLKKQAEENSGAKLVSITERLQTSMKALSVRIKAMIAQESQLQKAADEYGVQSQQLFVMLGANRILNQKMEAVQNLLGIYGEKLQEIDLMPKAGQRTLNELNTPSVGWFYGPKLPKYLLGGAAVGFILLSGLAVLMDLADRSYKNPSEISTDLGVPVLGHIPVMSTSRVKKSIESVDPSICAIHHSKGRVSEAFRSVRTGLYFSHRGKTLKVIQVTSPVPGDGKSTLSGNIAVTMAQSGRRVLLIDADLRRPRIAKIFGIEGDDGLAAVVSGKIEIDDAIRTGPVANLSILPGGKRPGNPAEILSSERFQQMIEVLRDKFDVIIVDTPPLLAVSDPGAVAGVVDGVVMCMRLRRNVKPLALRAKSILDAVGAELLGVVINGVSSEAGYGYNYDYNDYRYAYKYGSNYRTGYGYRYGYGSYRYGYTQSSEKDLSLSDSEVS